MTEIPVRDRFGDLGSMGQRNRGVSRWLSCHRRPQPPPEQSGNRRCDVTRIDYVCTEFHPTNHFRTTNCKGRRWCRAVGIPRRNHPISGSE